MIARTGHYFTPPGRQRDVDATRTDPGTRWHAGASLQWITLLFCLCTSRGMEPKSMHICKS